MKTYELTYIISPEITSEETEAKAKQIESVILDKEGIILKQLNPSAKTLSYPIKKYASGFLGVLEFQLEPENLAHLEEIIKKDGKITRYMIIIKEATKAKKERRGKTIKVTPTFEIEKKTEAINKKEKPIIKEPKEKVELKDIEQKLDELLS